MYIEDFLNNKIRIIVFIIAWVIIGLLLGYIELERLKEFAKINDERITKKKQFRILIKPAVVLFTMNILFFVISYLILKKIKL